MHSFVSCVTASWEFLLLEAQIWDPWLSLLQLGDHIGFRKWKSCLQGSKQRISQFGLIIKNISEFRPAFFIQEAYKAKYLRKCFQKVQWVEESGEKYMKPQKMRNILLSRAGWQKRKTFCCVFRADNSVPSCSLALLTTCRQVLHCWKVTSCFLHSWPTWGLFQVQLIAGLLDPRFLHICRLTQPQYCSNYYWKISMYEWTHTVQTDVVQGSAVVLYLGPEN